MAAQTAASFLVTAPSIPTCAKRMPLNVTASQSVCRAVATLQSNQINVDTVTITSGDRLLRVAELSDSELPLVGDLRWSDAALGWVATWSLEASGRRYLRSRGQRPCNDRTSGKPDEFPPHHGITPLAENHLGESLIRSSSESYAPHCSKTGSLMSALGQKRTFKCLHPMSALPRKRTSLNSSSLSANKRYFTGRASGSDIGSLNRPLESFQRDSRVSLR